jgi:dihydroorotate dehydrogenase (NAD+) catalytic subunit
MFIQELDLASPWINAPGTLGFAPPARWPLPEAPGVFVTNPVSLAPRSPAAARALVSFPGGYLMHTGHPNPGLSRVLRRFGERWSQSTIPIWVHLLGSNPGEIQQMAQRLEGVEGVMALEVGLPPGVRGAEALEFVNAAYGELPLVVSMPLGVVEEPWVADLPKWGAGAVCLSAPRGMLQDESGRLVSGRLFGPALLPQALTAVHAARKLGLQVIAGAGIYRMQDALLLRDAGASAVQLDAVLWRGWAY